MRSGGPAGVVVIGVLAPMSLACFDVPPRPSPIDTAESDAEVSDTMVDASDGDADTCTDCGPPCFLQRAGGCASVVELALGASHSCARLGDGSLWCWGQRDDGQLGDRVIDTSAPSSPVRVELAPIKAVAAGDEHTCALTITSEVWCWGRTREQQAPGDPASVTSGLRNAAPTRVELPVAAQAIALGARTSCALLVDGRVSCWGARLDGQSVDESMPGGVSSDPWLVAGLPGAPGVSTIRVGRWSACAWTNAASPALGATITPGGDVLRCWGDNDAGQLGVGDDDDRAEPSDVALPARFGALALGAHHSCGLIAPATIACWGANDEGQLARPLGAIVDTPSASTTIDGSIAELAVSDTGGCVLDANGAVRCWGRAQEGLLGDGITASSTRPTIVSGLPAARGLALGRRHACAITRDEAVMCWGEGDDGQLDGQVHAGANPSPRPVTATESSDGCDADGVEVRPGARHPSMACRVCDPLDGFVPCALGCDAGACGGVRALAIGGDERCAVRDDGVLVCWRDGFVTHSAEVDDRALGEVDELALADAFGCARVADEVRCWRSGEPAGVVLAGASALAAGGDSACAVVAGEVWCWRADESPIAVEGVAAIGAMRDVVVASEAACALTGDRAAVACWTRTGDVVGAPALVPLGQSATFDRLAAGRAHFLAIRAGGSDIAAWGDNASGQVDTVASAPIASVFSPLALRTRPARPIAAVAAGSGHSCVMSLSGRVECWGDQATSGVRAVLDHASAIAAHGDTTCAVVAGTILRCWSGTGSPERVVIADAP